MKLRVILEPFEVPSDEAALAYITALAIEVAVGSNRKISAIGFVIRKVGDLLEIQPVDRAQYAAVLDAVGALEVAEQVRRTPSGAVPLVNCSAFPEHGSVVSHPDHHRVGRRCVRDLQYPRGKEGSRDVARWQVREWNGNRYAEGRINFEKNGELFPTQKGITIRVSELREVIAWLEEAADELDAPEPRTPKRERRPASTIGAGPALSPEEEEGLF